MQPYGWSKFVEEIGRWSRNPIHIFLKPIIIVIYALNIIIKLIHTNVITFVQCNGAILHQP
jgi:hypothetical protein